MDTGEEHLGRGQAARLGFGSECGCSRKRHIVGLISPKHSSLITEEDFGFILALSLDSSSLVQSTCDTKPQEAAAWRDSSCQSSGICFLESGQHWLRQWLSKEGA